MSDVVAALGSFLAYLSLALICLWTVTFLVRVRWWTNPGGRLVALLSTWVSIGFAATILSVGTRDPGLPTLIFDLFVFGSVIYQWKLLVEGWLSHDKDDSPC